MLPKVLELLTIINGDSKSKSEQAEEELIKLCKPIMDKIAFINEKYGSPNLLCDSYSPHMGNISYDGDYGGEEISFTYGDSWDFGGSCCESMVSNNGENYYPI